MSNIGHNLFGSNSMVNYTLKKQSRCFYNSFIFILQFSLFELHLWSMILSIRNQKRNLISNCLRHINFVKIGNS